METNLTIDGSCLPALLLLIALGVYFAYEGYKTVLFFIELDRRGQSTKGRVIGFREESNDRIVHTYPLFSYQVDGKWCEAEADQAFFEPLRLGQEMMVRYLPENPAKLTWRKTGFVGVGSILLGLSLIASGGWLILEIGKNV